MMESKSFVADEAATAKTNRKITRKTSLLSLLCLIFLIIPNFNTIDFLPDFVAYFILARFFGKYSDLVPYFEEARNAFTKLGIVTVLKIPAMMIMLANMRSGRDIVALFTLIFISLELMLLLPAIRASFSAIFYVGERGDAPATVQPIKVFGKEMKAETLEGFSIFFVALKAVLNLIPDFFLMSNELSSVEESMRAMFPAATVICMAIVLAVGIAWLVIMKKYAVRIAAEGKFGAAVRSIAGSAKLDRLDYERGVKRRLSAITAMFLITPLSFDLSFEGLNSGANILPHMLLILGLTLISQRLFEGEADKRGALISGIVYALGSLYVHHITSEWHAEFSYSDLDYLTTAKDAYLALEIGSIAEVALIIPFAVFFTRGLLSFVRRVYAPELGIPESEVRLPVSVTVKALIYSIAPVLILALKAAMVFIRADVRYEIVNSTDIAIGAVTTSSAPWFGAVIVAVCIIYIFYSFYYTNELKGEVKMKYSTSESSFE